MDAAMNTGELDQKEMIVKPTIRTIACMIVAQNYRLCANGS